MTSIAYARDNDVVTLTIDMPGRSMNIFDAALLDDLEATLDRLELDDAARGVIITSGKESFIAGGDVHMLASLAHEAPSPEALFAAAGRPGALFRRLERIGKPVVAAIGGTALGGGLELALACHYRIVADDARIGLGFPEVTIGIIPGAGGTQRLPRLVGLDRALAMMLDGRPVQPARALELGLVDAVVPRGDLLNAAREWLLGPSARATPRWDDKQFYLPGPDIQSQRGAEILMLANARISGGAGHAIPATRAIVSTVYEGLAVPFDTALRVEQRHFAWILAQPEARAMMETLFIARQKLDKGHRRPAGIPPSPTLHLGVIGAGFMGSAIALSAARVGVNTTLVDTDPARLDTARAYISAQLAQDVSRGIATETQVAAIEARIHAATLLPAIATCDLVIEAIVEDPDAKTALIREIDMLVGPHAVIATNTSSLSVGWLAAALQEQDRFVGIHFFSPVDKMALVEIVRGSVTSDAALAKAIDLVRQLRKTPIIVRDTPGFYANQVVMRYLAEGLGMLAEGVLPALIENSARMAGMPIGPLALLDEVKIDLIDGALRRSGRYGQAVAVTARLIGHGRTGRVTGAGFYDYQGSAKMLWPGLAEEFPPAAIQPEASTVGDRFLYAQAIEAHRLFEAGIVEDADEANVGAILGWGFPSFTGGPLALRDFVGRDRFDARARELFGI